jgi:hypothetical protein
VTAKHGRLIIPGLAPGLDFPENRENNREFSDFAHFERCDGYFVSVPYVEFHVKQEQGTSWNFPSLKENNTDRLTDDIFIIIIII